MILGTMVYFIYYGADFGAGLFLCNCIPHLAAGLRGEAFPSPFAKPPGKGNSAPWVNVIWGTANLLIGSWLLSVGSFSVGANLSTLAFFAGFLLIGVPMSRHFAAVRNGRR